MQYHLLLFLLWLSFLLSTFVLVFSLALELALLALDVVALASNAVWAFLLALAFALAVCAGWLSWPTFWLTQA